MVVTDKEPIFDFEVFDEISKPEFISIYNINRVDEFLDIFYKDNPFTLKKVIWRIVSSLQDLILIMIMSKTMYMYLLMTLKRYTIK